VNARLSPLFFLSLPSPSFFFFVRSDGRKWRPQSNHAVDGPALLLPSSSFFFPSFFFFFPGPGNSVR